MRYLKRTFPIGSYYNVTMLLVVAFALVLLVALSWSSVGAQSLTTFSSGNVYNVQSTGLTQKVATSTVRPASFDCPTCSRWLPKSLHVPSSQDVVHLTSTELVVLQNDSYKQVIPIPSDCTPNYLANAGRGNFYIMCKSSAADAWKPKYQPVLRSHADGSYSLEPLQYASGDKNTVWGPSENNSAMVVNGAGGLYFVYIAGAAPWYVDTTNLTPSQIDTTSPSASTGNYNCSSVGPLEPINSDRFRIAVDCMQGGVQKRYIMNQDGVVSDIPPPLVCGSPLVSAPGWTYALVFCDRITYIADLASGAKKYVVRNGIAMGDQLLFLPSQHVVIVALNKDDVNVDLALEYQTAGAGRSVLRQTASTSPRPKVVAGDGALLSCSTDSAQNWCQLFNVINTQAVIAIFNLSTISPDAVIIDQGPTGVAAISLNPTGAGASATISLNPTGAGPSATISRDSKHIYIVAMVIVVLPVAIVLVLLTYVVCYCRRNKEGIRKPMQVSPEEGSRHSGCGESKRSSTASRDGSAEGGEDGPPSLQLHNTPPPPHGSVMVTGTKL